MLNVDKCTYLRMSVYRRQCQDASRWNVSNAKAMAPQYDTYSTRVILGQWQWTDCGMSAP